eukprot:1443278-Amphidinium_carterae.1
MELLSRNTLLILLIGKGSSFHAFVTGMSTLEILGCSSNRFSSSLPASLFSAIMLELVEFTVDSNSFTGTLPIELVRHMTGLQ